MSGYDGGRAPVAMDDASARISSIASLNVARLATLLQRAPDVIVAPIRIRLIQRQRDQSGHFQSTISGESIPSVWA